MLSQKKVFSILVVLSILVLAVSSDELLLKKKHQVSKAAPETPVEQQEEPEQLRHDPVIDWTRLMSKIDEMNCKKKNAKDYDVNLQEIKSNPKYIMPPTYLDVYNYVQCDLQKFPFWQCVDQAVKATSGWKLLNKDIIIAKYQDLGNKIDQNCKCKFTYKDFYLKQILNERIQTEKKIDIQALEKFFLQALDESKIKWEGTVTDYQTCVKDIFSNLAPKPMAFPSPFSLVNKEVAAQDCNSKISPEDLPKDNDFKLFAESKTESRHLLNYLTEKKLTEGNQYFICLQESILRVYPPRPEAFTKDTFTFLDPLIETCFQPQFEYVYEDYLREKDFRKYGNEEAQTCQDLINFINEKRWDCTYYKCVLAVLGPACYRPIPYPKFYDVLNTKADQFKCYDKLSTNDRGNDDKFKTWLSHTGRTYPDALNYLVEYKLQNSNSYWRCVYEIIISVYPPDPSPWPENFDYNQEFTDRKCLDLYRIKDEGPDNYKNDVEFKKLVKSSFQTCQQMIDYIDQKKWVKKRNYWQCIQEVIAFKCESVQAYPPQFNPLNEQRYLHSTDTDDMNCDYQCMQYKDNGCLDLDKEWKEYTKTIDKPADLYSYLHDKGWDNPDSEQYMMYFDCVIHKQLFYVYPLPPAPFVYPFEDMNLEYDNKGCYSNKDYEYGYEDYLKELDFRAFASNKDLLCDDLLSYIEQQELTTNYFTCVYEVIDKVCHDIKQFPAPFEQCNTEVITYKCYSLMTSTDRAADRDFKDFSENKDKYEQLYDYLGTIDVSSKYWNCLIDMMYHVYPPRPQPFPAKDDTFIALNDYFITQKCIQKGYDFVNYQRELKFRDFANYAKSCKDLRNYIESQSFGGSYFSCVKNEVIEEVCFRVIPFPPKFEKANTVVTQFGCYDLLDEKQSLDEDRPFKTYLATTAQNRDDIYTYFQFNLKKPNHKYWKCIKEVMIRTYPPSPKPFEGKWDYFNPYYTEFQCIQKGYDYEAYLSELGFRDFVAKANKCRDIRQYITDMQLTSEYFGCITKIISKGCGSAPPFKTPFSIANDHMIQQSCYDHLDKIIIAQDKEFKDFSYSKSRWEDLYGYLETKQLGGDYWQCVLFVLQLSYPPRPQKFPTQFDHLNKFFDESGCIESYKYLDWLEDAAFKKYAEKQKTCKNLQLYIEERKLNEFKSGYYSCVLINVIQRCRAIVPYPPQFAPMNDITEQFRCYDFLNNKDEILTQEPEWKAYTKSVIKYEDLYKRLDDQKFTSDYWVCTKDVLMHVYPPRPAKFTGEFIELNEEFDKANCIKHYNYENYLIENEFRPFVNKQKQCPPIRYWIQAQKLNNKYWNCMSNEVIENYCFKIIEFPKPYEQCNVVIKEEQCYDEQLYILENRKLDNLFKYFLQQRATGWDSVYEYVDNLIDGGQLTDKAVPFWKCVKIVLLRVHPLLPPKYPSPFENVQTEYDKLDCLSYGYYYDEYRYELDFKKFVGTVKERRRCDKLKSYIGNLDLPAKSKYFQCVNEAINIACFNIYEFPSQFNEANIVVQHAGCYDGIEYDTIIQDREFKVFASTVATYPDLYKYILQDKKYQDDYWNCMIIALYHIYPPRPEPFPDDLCKQNDKNLNSEFITSKCIDKYVYYDYGYELQFRVVAKKVTRGQQLLQVLSKNKLTDPYFVCVAEVIQKQCKNQNPFPAPFDGANPPAIEAGCDNYMETEDYKTDAEFKKALLTFPNWEAVHTYILKKNYKSDYWVCIKDVIWHVYPPRPDRLPTRFEPVQNQIDTNLCVEKYYGYNEYLYELEFRVFASKQQQCKPFKDWIQSRNLKNKYWDCLDQAIYDICYNIIPFNKPFLPLNPVVIETLNCYDDTIMSFEDLQQDKKFKQFASIQATYDSLSSYIVNKKYTSNYWQCIQEAIIRVYPPRPQPFSDPYTERNDEIYTLNCNQHYNYNDYLENQAFRDFVATTSKCGDVNKYLVKRQLDTTSQYFKCIYIAFNYCDNVQPFPVDYNYLQDEIIKLGCYNKMSNGDKEVDAIFKLALTESSSLIDIQNDFVTPRAISNKYWKCVQTAIMTILPPLPPAFPDQLRDVNVCYEQQQCYKRNYHLHTYKVEVKFREFAQTNTKCRDLEDYLNTRDLLQNNDYWQCVADCLSNVCGDVTNFYGGGDKTYELNIQVKNELGCYDLMTADDREQDRDFKASAEYMITGNEYITYVMDRKYESDYWQCIIKAVNIVYPPVIPWVGKYKELNDKFIAYNCKDQDYTYQDYQNDLLLRAYAEDAQKCGDLRRYIEANGWDSPFFQCQYRVIDQTCFKIIEFGASFVAVNEVIKTQNCYDLLEESEYKQDQEFKKFANSALDYQALHNYIKEKQLNSQYWECVTRSLLIVYPLPPSKFPPLFEELNIKYGQYNCLNKKYNYKEYKEELAFRQLVNRQTSFDCAPLKRFIDENKLLTSYWQCMSTVIDQGCFSIIDFSGPFKGINVWITKYACYESIKEDDKMKDQEFRKYVNNMAKSNDDVYNYISTNSLNSVYFQCILNAIEHYSPPKPPKFDGYFGFLNQHYFSNKCYAYSYDYKAYQEELKFRSFASTTESCEQLLTYMKSFKLNGDYWTCVNEIVVKMCYQVKTYPADYNRMNDAVKYLNCYAKMQPYNYNEDNDFKEYVRWKVAVPNNMRTYITTDKAYTDNYWTCVIDAIGLAYPSIFNFSGKFTGLNQFVKKCQDKGYYQFADVKKEEDFKTFAASKASTGDYQALIDYIWSKNLNSRYWNCVGYAIQSQGLFINGFADPRFEFLNYDSFGLQCLKNYKDVKTLDTQFKSYARTASKTVDLYNYLSKQSGPYWDCETKAIQKAYPPIPPNFPEKFSELNTAYNTKKCWELKDYDYSKYELEVKFRKESESAADCYQLLTMITGTSFSNTYFNCVKDSINSKCLEIRKFPLKFDKMNIQVDNLGCYAKMTGDEKALDQEYKTYAYSDAAEYADLKSYVVGKALSSDYWTCIKECVDHITIPRPPVFIELFQEINTNYDNLKCWTNSYSYSNYQTELQFRAAAVSYTECKQLRDYIKQNNLKDTYFRCVGSAIDKSCPFTFGEKFQALDDGINKCQASLTSSDSSNFESFKIFINSKAQSYLEVYTYLVERQYTSQFWICVVNVIISVEALPQATPPYTGELEGLENEEKTCKNEYNFYDYVLDLKLRAYGSNNNNCYQFREYALKTSGIKVVGTNVTPYLTCFGTKLDTVCPPELDFPDRFKEFRDQYNNDQCRYKRTAQDLIDDGLFRVYANQDNVQAYQDLYIYLGKKAGADLIVAVNNFIKKYNEEEEKIHQSDSALLDKSHLGSRTAQTTKKALDLLDFNSPYWMCVIFAFQKANKPPLIPGTGVFKNTYFQKYYVKEKCSNYEYNFYTFVNDSKFRKAVDSDTLSLDDIQTQINKFKFQGSLFFSCYTTAVQKAKEEKAQEPPPIPPAPTVTNKELYGKYYVDDNCQSASGDCRYLGWKYNNKSYKLRCPREGKNEAWIQNDSTLGDIIRFKDWADPFSTDYEVFFSISDTFNSIGYTEFTMDSAKKSYFRIYKCENEQFKTYKPCAGRNQKLTFVVQRFYNDAEIKDCRFVIYKL